MRQNALAEQDHCADCREHQACADHHSDLRCPGAYATLHDIDAQMGETQTMNLLTISYAMLYRWTEDTFVVRSMYNIHAACTRVRMYVWCMYVYARQAYGNSSCLLFTNYPSYCMYAILPILPILFMLFVLLSLAASSHSIIFIFIFLLLYSMVVVVAILG